MTTHRPTLAAALAVSLAIVLAGCSGGKSETNTGSTNTAGAAFATPDADEKGGEKNPVTIGVVGADGPQFTVLKKNALDEGIHIELVDFTDYQQPNPATTSGDLDLNQFQHIKFLAQYNIESSAGLVPIGSTAIYPLALYSSQYDSVDEIPAGAQITIPNDETNQARALGVLASAGLIELDANVAPLFATPDDIVAATSHVVVTPVAANQTGRTLEDPSVAGAIINNDYVADSGLDPSEAIAQDDPSSPAALPYVNIWVSRAQDATNPVYVEIVRLAAQEDFGKALEENSAGSGVVLNVPADKLQSDLAEVEAQLRDNS